MKTLVLLFALCFQFSAHAELLNSNELGNLPNKILKKTKADKIINVKFSTAYLMSIGSVLSYPIRFIADGDESLPVAGHIYDLKFTAVKGKHSVDVNCYAFDRFGDVILDCRVSTKYREYLVMEIFNDVRPYFSFTYRELND